MRTALAVAAISLVGATPAGAWESRTFSGSGIWESRASAGDAVEIQAFTHGKRMREEYASHCAVVFYARDALVYAKRCREGEGIRIRYTAEGHFRLRWR